MRKQLDTLKGLLTHMEQACNEENWPVLARLDAEFYALLKQQRFDAFPVQEQTLYREDFAQLHALQQALFMKCSAAQTLNVQNLHSLRKQKNAEHVYQSIQSHS